MFVKGLLAVVPVIFMLTNAKLSTLKTPINVPIYTQCWATLALPHATLDLC